MQKPPFEPLFTLQRISYRLYRYIRYRMISNADPELEQLVHTDRTPYQSYWPRGLGELNPSPISRTFFFRLSGLQSSLPLIHSRDPPVTVRIPQCSHCAKVWHWIYLICDVPLSRSVLRSSNRVNRGPIWNGFRACARAPQYGVKIALVRYISTQMSSSFLSTSGCIIIVILKVIQNLFPNNLGRCC